MHMNMHTHTWTYSHMHMHIHTNVDISLWKCVQMMFHDAYSLALESPLAKCHPIYKKDSFLFMISVTWKLVFIWQETRSVWVSNLIHLVYSGTAGDDPRLTSFLWHWWLAQGRMGTGFWLAPRRLGRHLAACKTQEGNMDLYCGLILWLQKPRCS